MNIDNRKGELAEIRAQLRSLAGSRSNESNVARREVFKRVVSYMTVGIDVSSIFSEMIMCTGNTNDVVLKKMCYLYLSTYAHHQSDLALLTVNFLQKDCRDDDPMIRGLALRTLCSLRVKNLVEYLVGPLEQALKDAHSYVRKTACMGVLKLHYLAPSAAEDAGFIGDVRGLLLQDRDGQVVATALQVLREILSSSRGAGGGEAAVETSAVLVSRQLVYALLNRMKEFSEWSQCAVLDLVASYSPENSEEIFDIMNVLEDRMQHANSAVVLATVKVFLHLTLPLPAVHQQVYERIKAPLLTLVRSPSPEIAYAVLVHMHLMVTRAPILFSSEYKNFYCRYNDPTYVKKLKLEMLTAVADGSNTYDIVTELSEYVADIDETIARLSLRAIGRIALQSDDAPEVGERLLQFLDSGADYIVAETLIVTKDLLRRYPKRAASWVTAVADVPVADIQEPDARAALIWIFGEYGQELPDAPYVLENLAQTFLDEESPKVRSELLTAAAKLFFQRPPECQYMLGTMLEYGCQDSHQDVHDRALLYYRLLQHNVDTAAQVINGPKDAVLQFLDDQSGELKDRLFDEFNTLAVVYRQPSYDLAAAKARVQEEEEAQQARAIDLPENSLLRPEEREDDVKAGALSPNANGKGGDYAAPLAALLDSFPPAPSVSTPPTASTTAPPLSAAASSSPLDDLLGGFGALGLPSAAPALAAAPAPPQKPPALMLSPRPVLDATTFQKKWGALPLATTLGARLPSTPALSAATTQDIIKHMSASSILCIASGGQAPNYKFYMFAQNADQSSLFLVELLMDRSTATATAKIKAENASTVGPFGELFTATLGKFGT
eukprot:jgi/Chlat1/146/Chrsp1S03236